MVNRTEKPQTTVANESVSSQLHVQLEQVAKMVGVQGYICRNETTAAVNLRESGRVQDYALLSADAFAAAEQLTGVFGLGGVSDLVVECDAFKFLCLYIDDDAVCVFMEKSVDAVAIKTLLMQS